MADADLLEALTPKFREIVVFRAVRTSEDGTVIHSSQQVYESLQYARTRVHSYKHYMTTFATSNIAIYTCHPETGEWQIEHLFEQGEDLSTLPWQRGKKKK